MKLANLNHQFDVKIDGYSLERTKTYKYLGIDLDESLSWDSFMTMLSKKYPPALGLSNVPEIWFPARLLLWSIKLSSSHISEVLNEEK